MVEQVYHALEGVAAYLWGWPMLVFLLATGGMMTVVLGGLQFTKLVPALWAALGPAGRVSHGKGSISNRAALMTALAATVGTGNIAGVATAIAIGGPGALLWMWVSGLLGMALKFAEALLGVHYRVKLADADKYHGGPMYYLSLGAGLPWLGALYAVLIALAAMCIGGMVQNNAIVDVMRGTFGFEPLYVGGMVVVAAALVMFGGVRQIAMVADKLVPAMIVLYVAAGMMVLLANAAYIPQALWLVVDSAFNGHAAAGGFAGAGVMAAMRFGLARGVFSNESGQGSAAIVAATAQTKHPVEQALVSMTQTFIDTIVVCTFTGLVILVSGAWTSEAAASAGAGLTSLAFTAGLGGASIEGIPLGGAIVAVSLLLFSFSTILGWGYYGQQGAVYALGTRVAKPYLAVFLLATFGGAWVLDMAANAKVGVLAVWALADVLVGIMIVPNLIGLWLLAGTVRRLTADYFTVQASGGKYKYPAFYEDRLANTALPVKRKKASMRKR
ncbi:MAG: sodium:alanine symporter family protein [Pseudomonadaceae bacterium]|nr:sodium:alanine symporter family protein [Pseudomonadaceae bacterium]